MAFTAQDGESINGKQLKVERGWALIAGMLGTSKAKDLKNHCKMLY
jgi:hypothetical protein